MPDEPSDWTIRRVEDDIGRTACELITPVGTRVCFELLDGGGFCESVGVWRVEGRLWGVVEAGSGTSEAGDAKILVSPASVV